MLLRESTCSLEDDDGKENELVELDGERDGEGDSMTLLFTNESDLLNWGIWHLFNAIRNYTVSFFLLQSSTLSDVHWLRWPKAWMLHVNRYHSVLPYSHSDLQ